MPQGSTDSRGLKVPFGASGVLLVECMRQYLKRSRENPQWCRLCVAIVISGKEKNPQLKILYILFI